MRFQRQGLRTGISKLQGNFSKTVTKPEKVAISMHCNLRPPDFASVVLRFNYKTHSYQVWSRLAYSFLTENVITVDTLRYAVTLTFDPLTLDVCSVSAVTCWNYLYHVFAKSNSTRPMMTGQIFPADVSWGNFVREFSGVHGSNCTKFWWGHRPIKDA